MQEQGSKVDEVLKVFWVCFLVCEMKATGELTSEGVSEERYNCYKSLNTRVYKWEEPEQCQLMRAFLAFWKLEATRVVCSLSTW